MIKLSEKAKEHLFLHFANSNAPGSIFFDHVFANADELLNYINAVEASSSIPQANNRKSLVYHMTEPVGKSGLIRRDLVPTEQIVIENRNGFQVEVALVKELALAFEFCVIVESSNDEEYLITAFPGGFSMPFPYAGQDPEEFERSKLFWEEHVLCKEVIE